jgi:uncharacterized membrane protein YhhN
MLNGMIIGAAAVLLVLLLLCEKREAGTALLVVKTTLSALFILAAAVQPPGLPGYRAWLMAGLLFCLAGDVFLALRWGRAFLLGLVAFLLGHVLYLVAFVPLARAEPVSLVGSLIVFVISTGIYFWLRPHLGSMNGPVVFYIVVISLMLSAAWGVLTGDSAPASGRAMVFAGALCFYVSDVFVARDRFLRNEFLNRLLGLPLYYGGQFLLALSTAFIR